MVDLVKRLTIKAGVMEMGEVIAWGSDTALMREAAARIDALESQVKAADALAEAAGELSLSKYGLKACRVRTALAAYKAAKEGGA